MLNQTSSYLQLAEQADRGEQHAATMLRDQLAPQMSFIVRRVLRTGEVRSALDQRIANEAKRLLAHSGDTQLHNDQELLVQEVAHQLCQRIYQQSLHGSAPTRMFSEDTFRVSQ